MVSEPLARMTGTHPAEKLAADAHPPGTPPLFLPEILRTGVREIDAQHEALFRQVNQIEQSCIDRNRLKQEDADALLQSLHQHFLTEKGFAARAGLDFAEHERHHDDMYRTVSLALEYSVQRLEGVFGVARYLQYWFERHIVQDDQLIGQALALADEIAAAK